MIWNRDGITWYSEDEVEVLKKNAEVFQKYITQNERLKEVIVATDNDNQEELNYWKTKISDYKDLEDKYKFEIKDLKAKNERLKEDIAFYSKQLSTRVVLLQKAEQTLQEIDEIISRTESHHPPSVANMVSIIRHKLYELTKAEEE